MDCIIDSRYEVSINEVRDNVMGGNEVSHHLRGNGYEAAVTHLHSMNCRKLHQGVVMNFYLAPVLLMCYINMSFLWKYKMKSTQSIASMSLPDRFPCKQGRIHHFFGSQYCP